MNADVHLDIVIEPPDEEPEPVGREPFTWGGVAKAIRRVRAVAGDYWQKFGSWPLARIELIADGCPEALTSFDAGRLYEMGEDVDAVLDACRTALKRRGEIASGAQPQLAV